VNRTAAIVIAGALVTGQAVLAQNSTTTEPPLEFEVASIKLHPPDNSGQFQSSMRTLPNGQMVLTNVSLRTLVGRAYPSRGSTQVAGVPSWAEGKYYDVNVKANRPVSRDEQQEMWRALLAERLKLAAHYEPREEPAFDLLFARADHRLGPQMKPSTCTPLPAPAPGSAPAPAKAPTGPPNGADVMARCNGFVMQGNHVYAPRSTIATIAGFLRSGAGRLVVDKTGLEGLYDVEFWYAGPSPTGPDAGAIAEKLAANGPTDAPEFFTAVREQLGFKLEPSKTQVEVLVIDHLEPPTQN